MTVRFFVFPCWSSSAEGGRGWLVASPTRIHPRLIPSHVFGGMSS